MYLVPLPSKREQAIRRRRRSGLGQAYDSAPQEYSVDRAFLTLKLIDKNGRVIPFQKFYLDILIDPKGGYPESRDNHFSRTTDESGLIRLAEPWEPPFSRYLSVTPLFKSAYAPKDIAILWHEPVTFGTDPSSRPMMTVVLEPGGGLKKPSLPAPLPQMPVPQAPQAVPPKASEEIPWGPIAVGGLAFAAALYFIPRFMGKGE